QPVPGPSPTGLEAVFPQEVGLLADIFSRETSYPFCSHMLTIDQHYRAQLGVAALLWEAALTLRKYFEEQNIMGILATLHEGDVMITELPLASKQRQEYFHKNLSAEHSAWAQVCAVSWGADIVCLKETYPLLNGALQNLGGQQSTEAGMQGRHAELPEHYQLRAAPMPLDPVPLEPGRGSARPAAQGLEAWGLP
uniref:Uncharacterized protein n=1 Tax=Chrysemys picta bellii TaxID=8478 RepID=A0A8C3FCC5_CHRPI